MDHVLEEAIIKPKNIRKSDEEGSPNQRAKGKVHAEQLSAEEAKQQIESTFQQHKGEDTPAHIKILEERAKEAAPDLDAGVSREDGTPDAARTPDEQLEALAIQIEEKERELREAIIARGDRHRQRQSVLEHDIKRLREQMLQAERAKQAQLKQSQQQEQQRESQRSSEVVREQQSRNASRENGRQAQQQVNQQMEAVRTRESGKERNTEQTRKASPQPEPSARKPQQGQNVNGQDAIKDTARRESMKDRENRHRTQQQTNRNQNQVNSPETEALEQREAQLQLRLQKTRQQLTGSKDLSQADQQRLNKDMQQLEGRISRLQTRIMEQNLSRQQQQVTGKILEVEGRLQSLRGQPPSAQRMAQEAALKQQLQTLQRQQEQLQNQDKALQSQKAQLAALRKEINNVQDQLGNKGVSPELQQQLTARLQQLQQQVGQLREATQRSYDATQRMTAPNMQADAGTAQQPARQANKAAEAARRANEAGRTPDMATQPKPKTQDPAEAVIKAQQAREAAEKSAQKARDTVNRVQEQLRQSAGTPEQQQQLQQQLTRAQGAERQAQRELQQANTKESAARQMQQLLQGLTGARVFGSTENVPKNQDAPLNKAAETSPDTRYSRRAHGDRQTTQNQGASVQEPKPKTQDPAEAAIKAQQAREAAEKSAQKARDTVNRVQEQLRQSAGTPEQQQQLQQQLTRAQGAERQAQRELQQANTKESAARQMQQLLQGLTGARVFGSTENVPKNQDAPLNKAAETSPDTRYLRRAHGDRQTTQNQGASVQEPKPKTQDPTEAAIKAQQAERNARQMQQQLQGLTGARVFGDETPQTQTQAQNPAQQTNRPANIAAERNSTARSLGNMPDQPNGPANPFRKPQGEAVSPELAQIRAQRALSQTRQDAAGTQQQEASSRRELDTVNQRLAALKDQPQTSQSTRETEALQQQKQTLEAAIRRSERQSTTQTTFAERLQQQSGRLEAISERLASNDLQPEERRQLMQERKQVTGAAVALGTELAGQRVVRSELAGFDAVKVVGNDPGRSAQTPTSDPGQEIRMGVKGLGVDPKSAAAGAYNRLATQVKGVELPEAKCPPGCTCGAHGASKADKENAAQTEKKARSEKKTYTDASTKKEQKSKPSGGCPEGCNGALGCCGGTNPMQEQIDAVMNKAQSFNAAQTREAQTEKTTYTDASTKKEQKSKPSGGCPQGCNGALGCCGGTNPMQAQIDAVLRKAQNFNAQRSSAHTPMANQGSVIDGARRFGNGGEKSSEPSSRPPKSGERLPDNLAHIHRHQELSRGQSQGVALPNAVGA